MSQRLTPNAQRLLWLAGCWLGSCGMVRADLIQQGSGYNRTVLMTSGSDHITGATGLTLTVMESRAGGAFVAVAPVVTEIGNGWYKITLGAGDTSTLGPLNLHVTAAGADPSDTADQVVAFNPNDPVLLGLTGVGTLANQTAISNSIGGIVPGLLGATVDSGGGTTLTVKQALFLAFVGSVGKFGNAVRSTSAPWTISVPFLRLDGTTTGWSYVTTYSDGTFSKAVSRTFTVGTLP